MRLVIWGIMVLLLVSVVNAEMKVNCESDAECYLVNEDAYCSEGYCYSHNSGYLTIEDLQPKSNEFEWNTFSVEPITYRCDNCLKLAPSEENWFTKFVDWFLFVE